MISIKARRPANNVRMVKIFTIVRNIVRIVNFREEDEYFRHKMIREFQYKFIPMVKSNRS